MTAQQPAERMAGAMEPMAPEGSGDTRWAERIPGCDRATLISLIEERIPGWTAALETLEAAIRPHIDGSFLRAMRGVGSSGSPPTESTLSLGATDQPAADELLAGAVGALLQIHQDRNQLLQAAQRLGLTGDSLTAVITAFATSCANNPSDAKLQTRAVALRDGLERISARLEPSRSRALTAWVLARRTLLHNDAMLRVLSEGETPRSTYGRSQAVTSHGALVNRCA